MKNIKFFIDNNNQEINVDIEDKQITLLVALKQNGIGIKSNCEGNGVCGMCHVILDQKTYDKYEIDEDEEDKVLSLINCTPTSRLACKIILDENFDGAHIRIDNFI